MQASSVPRLVARHFGVLAKSCRAPRTSFPMASTSRAASGSTTSTSPPWISTLRDRHPPRFSDAPDLYWLGGERGTGGSQVHGEDSVFGLLHHAGAFHDPSLLVDSSQQEVLLVLKTGARTAGHPGWTHGGFTSLLLDEMAGQAYCEFVQPTRGPGVTANLSVDYAKPLPTESHILVTAKINTVDGRKVKCEIKIIDGAAFVEKDGNKNENNGVFASATALFIVLAKD